MMDPTSSTRPRAFASRGGDRSSPRRKTNRRALLLALLLGTVAAALIVFYLGRPAAAGNQPEVTMVEVVAATRDIAAGQQITDAMVEVKVLPTEAVIPNTAGSIDQVLGQTLRYPVAKGEQISNLRLLELSKVQALSFQIPKGLRAFTIPVNVTNTPAALIAPGDHVDVLVTGPLQTLRLVPQLAAAGAQNSDVAGTATFTLLQNIQVLTVQEDYVANGVPYDSSVRGEPSGNGRVSYMTLALTPEQGQLLSLAKGGSITLSLRAFGDEDTAELEPAVSMVQVVVAAEKILAGQEITPLMVELKTMPATAATQSAATTLTQVVGQISKYPVTKGEQLSLNAAELGRSQALSFQIPDGLRAFTMPVEVSKSPAALIVPGDYVDVLVALDVIDFGRNAPILEEGEAADEDWKGTVTLFQNLRVLAVQREYVDKGVPYDASVRGAPIAEGGTSYMTFAVTPKQAQLLWLAVAKDGLMTVTLRPYGDDQTKPLEAIIEPVQWSAISSEGQ